MVVDPFDSKVVYAGSPAGLLFKSVDGGMAWEICYELVLGLRERP
jgi:hypothetical protein